MHLLLLNIDYSIMLCRWNRLSYVAMRCCYFCISLFGFKTRSRNIQWYLVLFITLLFNSEKSQKRGIGTVFGCPFSIWPWLQIRYVWIEHKISLRMPVLKTLDNLYGYIFSSKWVCNIKKAYIIIMIYSQNNITYLSCKSETCHKDKQTYMLYSR